MRNFSICFQWYFPGHEWGMDNIPSFRRHFSGKLGYGLYQFIWAGIKGGIPSGAEGVAITLSEQVGSNYDLVWSERFEPPDTPAGEARHRALEWVRDQSEVAQFREAVQT